MLAYIIRRVLYVIPVVFGVALITFILFNVVGWNAAAQMLGKRATPEEIAVLQKQLGLSGPLHEQFGHYLKQIVTFDFGRSFATNQKISTLIRDGVLPSLALAVPIFIIDLVIAIGVALFAAFYRNTWLDRTIVVLAVMGMSVSMLVYIIAGQYLVAYQWASVPHLGLRVREIPRCCRSLSALSAGWAAACGFTGP